MLLTLKNVCLCTGYIINQEAIKLNHMEVKNG